MRSRHAAMAGQYDLARVHTVSRNLRAIGCFSEVFQRCSVRWSSMEMEEGWGMKGNWGLPEVSTESQVFCGPVTTWAPETKLAGGLQGKGIPAVAWTGSTGSSSGILDRRSIEGEHLPTQWLFRIILISFLCPFVLSLYDLNQFWFYWWVFFVVRNCHFCCIFSGGV